MNSLPENQAGLGGAGNGQVVSLLAEQRTGGWPVDLLGSRNARPEKPLGGRAQWEPKQATLP